MRSEPETLYLPSEGNCSCYFIGSWTQVFGSCKEWRVNIKNTECLGFISGWHYIDFEYSYILERCFIDAVACQRWKNPRLILGLGEVAFFISAENRCITERSRPLFCEEVSPRFLDEVWSLPILRINTRNNDEHNMNTMNCHGIFSKQLMVNKRSLAIPREFDRTTRLSQDTILTRYQPP